MTAPLDEARLRELAEAASEGPWTLTTGQTSYPECDDADSWSAVLTPQGREVLTLYERYGVKGDDRSDYDDDAAFIAAANPATILALLDALSAERAVSQRWHDAYSIAHDQATENGQRASAERERGDRAVGLLRRIADDDTFDGPSSARLFLATQKADQHPRQSRFSGLGREGSRFNGES